MTTLFTAILKTASKIPSVFNNILGWVFAAISSYIIWLGDAKGSILLILICIFWDMSWGVAAAVKQHRFVLSHLLRETFWKVVVYIGSLSIIFYAERTLGLELNLTIKVLSVLGASIEMFSAAGNILIIKPDFIFVRFFSKYLIGEISEKMKKSEDEVKAMLENEKNGTHKTT